jgi:hypothetical protein
VRYHYCACGCIEYAATKIAGIVVINDALGNGKRSGVMDAGTTDGTTASNSEPVDCKFSAGCN